MRFLHWCILAVVFAGCSGEEFQAGSEGSGDTQAGSGGSNETSTDGGGTSSSGETATSSSGEAGKAGGSAGDPGESGGTDGRSGSHQGAAGDAETAGNGGTAGSGDGDGGAAGSDCDAKTTYYPDKDMDNAGVTSDAVQLCAAAGDGFSEEGGDCNDDDPSVHPYVEEYFGTPYQNDENRNSFDYDCSGEEESDPEQLGAAPACSSLSLLNCEGSGYLPNNSRNDADNPLCGSVMVRVCIAETVACGSMLVEAAPHRCR